MFCSIFGFVFSVTTYRFKEILRNFECTLRTALDFPHDKNKVVIRDSIWDSARQRVMRFSFSHVCHQIVPGLKTLHTITPSPLHRPIILHSHREDSGDHLRWETAFTHTQTNVKVRADVHTQPAWEIAVHNCFHTWKTNPQKNELLEGRCKITTELTNSTAHPRKPCSVMSQLLFY